MFEILNTKQKILLEIASMYDSLGISGPLMIRGRKIMKQMCRIGVGWDDIIPETVYFYVDG